MAKTVSEEKRIVYEDYSGGVVLDNPLRKFVNECLQAKNVQILTKGGYEKRKGSECLNPGVGLNSESDVWAVVLWNHTDNGGEYAQEHTYGYICEGNYETYEERDRIIYIEFDTPEEVTTEYAAWAAAMGDIADTYEKGTYSLWHNHKFNGEATVHAYFAWVFNSYYPSIFGSEANVNDKDPHNITSTQWAALNYCVFGLWEEIAEYIDETITAYFDDSINKITSMVELNRRDTTVGDTYNDIDRILMATYYIDNSDPDTDYGILVKLTTSGDTLTITGQTILDATLWAGGKPRWAIYQNRAFMVNGVGTGTATPDRIWTDGTTTYQIGIDAPTDVPTLEAVVASTGGYLTDGTYIITYSYRRSTEYETESNLCTTTLSVTCSEGTSTQKITIGVTESTDAQVDGIRIYRTKVNGILYYYESLQENATADDIVVGSLSDAGLTILADNLGSGNDNDRPPESNYICVNSDRMFYSTENRVYYSKVGEPEQVPADNYRSFDPDDGEQITGIFTFKRYVIITKKTKTWIMDSLYPDQLKPFLLSSNIGCIADTTFSVCMSGQIAIWLSQEGFYLTDGEQIKSITTEKIYRALMKDIDKSIVDRAIGVYYPNDAQYICYVPYLNDQYRIWVYTIPMDNFVTYEFPWRPYTMGLWSDENDIKRLIIGTLCQGVQDGRRSYFGTFMQADKDNHYKDVLTVGTCSDYDAVTYQNIPMTVITSWDWVQAAELLKLFYSFEIEWYANGSTTATVTFKTDYGRKTASATITHSGIENEPSEDEWYLGYEKIQGWDYESIKTDTDRVPVGVVTGTENSQTLKSRNLSTRFYETSQKFVRVYALSIIYKIFGLHMED